MLPGGESVGKKGLVGGGQRYEGEGLGCIFDCGDVDWYDEVGCGGTSVCSDLFVRWKTKTWRQHTCVHTLGAQIGVVYGKVIKAYRRLRGGYSDD